MCWFLLLLFSQNSQYVGNIAAESGGAVHSLSSLVSLSGDSLSGNTAATGGAVNVNSGAGPLLLSGCHVTGNTALESGGALYAAQVGVIHLSPVPPLRIQR